MSFIKIIVTEKALDSHTVQYSKEVKILGVLVYSKYSSTENKQVLEEFYTDAEEDNKSKKVGFCT